MKKECEREKRFVNIFLVIIFLFIGSFLISMFFIGTVSATSCTISSDCGNQETCNPWTCVYNQCIPPPMTSPPACPNGGGPVTQKLYPDCGWNYSACSAVCGDGVCESGETTSNCPQDCRCTQSSDCGNQETCNPSSCINGQCTLPEMPKPPVCPSGDGSVTLNPYPDCNWNFSACSAVCGDGVCESGEANTRPVCNPGEMCPDYIIAGTCPQDCVTGGGECTTSADCGNQETCNPWTCVYNQCIPPPMTSPPACPNGGGPVTQKLYPDCGWNYSACSAVCGDGVCESGETTSNCPQDCRCTQSSDCGNQETCNPSSCINGQCIVAEMAMPICPNGETGQPFMNPYPNCNWNYSSCVATKNLSFCLSDSDCGNQTSCYPPKCSFGICLFKAGMTMQPCSSAVWNDYPTCKWDNSSCVQNPISCPAPNCIGQYFTGQNDSTGCPIIKCAVCGNGVCEPGETISSCPSDCRMPTDDLCSHFRCGLGNICSKGKCVRSLSCGNRKCESNLNETSVSCPYDCPGCGDGNCESYLGETVSNCPIDCHLVGNELCKGVTCPIGQICSNGTCVHSLVCGNGVCEPNENPANCPSDCKIFCGNGYCDIGETNANCPSDCLSTCGNGVCDPTETYLKCSKDCTNPSCGNWICDPGETNANCPIDCKISTCGNGVCDPTETHTNCPIDCQMIFCGDGICEIKLGDPVTYAESFTNCPYDCKTPFVCGNGKCENYENPISCPEDCKTSNPSGCGNGKCESELGETSTSCPKDCGGTICTNDNQCGNRFCNLTSGACTGCTSNIQCQMQNSIFKSCDTTTGLCQKCAEDDGTLIDVSANQCCSGLTFQATGISSVKGYCVKTGLGGQSCSTDAQCTPSGNICLSTTGVAMQGICSPPVYCEVGTAKGNAQCAAAYHLPILGSIGEGVKGVGCAGSSVLGKYQGICRIGKIMV